MASIRKRITSTGQVRWDARVRIGAVVQTRTHRTKALAEEWARTIEDSHRLGEAVADPTLARSTLAAFADGWLDSRRLAPRTRLLYRDLLDRYILPGLGDVQVRHLSSETVRRWWSRQPNNTTAAKAYRLLRSICATAVDDAVLRRQPCTIAGAGREHASERPLATPAQIMALTDAIDDRYRVAVVLAGWCGLRVAEVLGLERRHVDLLHGAVTVEQSAQWLPGRGRTLQPPKSTAGRRMVPMPAVARQVIEHHLATYAATAPNAPVLVGERGGPATPSLLAAAWRNARAVTGLGHLHFHDLRHAAGTMVAQTGATQREIQAHLGHASPAAAHRYQHAAADRMAAIAAGMDAIAAVVPIRSRDDRAIGGGVDPVDETRNRL